MRLGELIIFEPWRENYNFSLLSPPCVCEVVCSIPGPDRPKFLKTGGGDFPPWRSGIRDSTTTGPAGGRDNGLVKHWLKIVQETWICELSPLHNLYTVDTA